MKNIILAFPSRTFIECVEKSLNKAGFIVHICTNGDEIIEEMAKINCNGIFIDMILPPGEAFGMDKTEDGMITGKVVAEYLSEIKPQLPIVILTSNKRALNLPANVTTLPLMDFGPSRAVEMARKF